MTLPRKIPKSPKRSSRWRSQAHLNFIRSFRCAMCDAQDGVEAAHVRLGSGAGLGMKPDDFRCVPLCSRMPTASKAIGCHNYQHTVGERGFWRKYRRDHGQTVEQLLDELCRASPKRAEIERVKREREG